MPNWCTNTVEIEGKPEDVKEVVDFLGEDRIKFNKIVPMPEDLNITSGSQTSLGLAVVNGGAQAKKFLGYKWIQDKGIVTEEQLRTWVQECDPEAWEIGLKAASNIEKYGHATWYGWAIENWGTKWEAHSVDEGEFTGDGYMVYCFDTAWSPPSPVIAELSRMFPKVYVTLKFIEAGVGFAGYEVYKSGEIDDSYEYNCSPTVDEYCEFCLEMCGYDPSDPEYQ